MNYYPISGYIVVYIYLTSTFVHHVTSTLETQNNVIANHCLVLCLYYNDADK